ncbi:Gypsy retrotransposon integrase-like protein 1 [Marasmius crinis-equi]|uniref:Gypsy retrotransposon integrase-like protein 1 n=1 Tax=Marasmius crinis-equi TaxID=585013 RepID=A0ABR3FQ32_9AGAR
MPDGRCSNCLSADLICPHTIPAKKRGPKGKHTKSRLLEKASNTLDSSQSPSGGSEDISQSRPSSPHSTITRLDENGFQDPVLASYLKKLCLDVSDDKYFGITSAQVLLRHGQLAKKECFENRLDIFPQDYYKRPQFWTHPSWEKPFIPTALPPRFRFPPHDLMSNLISSYFSKVNLIYPLLHRPSFEASILDGLHLVEPQLACILLLVCSLGSKYTNDTRVFANSVEQGKELSSGWQWYEQVESYRKTLSPFTSSLLELQYHCLVVLYVHGLFVPSSTWTLIGSGVRVGVEIGLHRRPAKNRQRTSEDELKLRAFWVLVAMDRVVSSWLGRPCVIQDGDIDADYPTECDDEYWQNDGSPLVFRQPPNTPSKISFFVHYLKLCEIISFAMITVHSARKPKLAIGLIPDDWDCRLVEHLNASMRSWLDDLPEHLRWKPRSEDDIFLPQSAFIYTVYYFTEIQIQRPVFQQNSSLRSITVGAAKSALEVLHTLIEKRHVLYLPEMVFSCLTSIIVLLTDMWKTKKVRQTDFDGQQAAADAERAFKVLREFESRYCLAGRLSDLLADLSLGLEEVVPTTKESSGSTQPPHPQYLAAPVNTASSTSQPSSSSESGISPPGWHPPHGLSETAITHGSIPTSPYPDNGLQWSTGPQPNWTDFINSLDVMMGNDFWQLPA